MSVTRASNAGRGIGEKGTFSFSSDGSRCADGRVLLLCSVLRGKIDFSRLPRPPRILRSAPQLESQNAPR